MLLKLFIASCAICLVVQDHFALQRWMEAMPFTNSWAYYHNLHPFKHTILVGLQWTSLATTLILGVVLIARRRESYGRVKNFRLRTLPFHATA